MRHAARHRGNKPMRNLRRLVPAACWGLAAALALTAVPKPIGAASSEPSSPSEEQKQTEQDRCKFLMESINGIILSLNPDGEITSLNHYGRSFFGYSEQEILGKPMLGTLTPPTGFEGRDLSSYLAGLVRHPDRYAFSVNENTRRSGERVTIFWANKGISDAHGEVREVLRVGLDITERQRRLRTAAQELRGIGQMLENRSWVQRKKLKDITSRIEEISREMERPWLESESGVFESVAPAPR
jgi:PAS domain S-box-containing protein